MAQEKTCLRCGADIAADAPEGLCFRCLMQAAMSEGAKPTLDAPAHIEGPGTMIGRYELLNLLGEGGMGLVYLAEQKEPVRRKVALKIIKPGMDSRQVVARFEAERQALALLDHPNIAHVFDAGCTETGRPYFVMEYVKGLPVTHYCDHNKLTIEQRLRLFEQVCEAVHHAHQKGIIHRDLKPSNILVSVHGDRAVPKIIDFGIAKAITQPLTDKTFVTFQGQLLGTPEYMSPEQVDLAAQDIDTRSDIYSLGVVLYELLAGVLPFESESFAKVGLAEIQRTIREDEPASPSMRLTSLGEKAKTIAESRGTQVVPLARRLHRELEWIPLKAMRKDRCRRYRSASEMADDIRNYLTGLPLLAGPETTLYRVQKFVHKHAGSVATVALVAVAIVLGLVVSTAMYWRSERALQREAIARTQAEQARVSAEDARAKETAARTQAEQAEQATKQKAEELRRTLYVNSIQLADAKYKEGNISRVHELLASCPNDLRGWEWNRINYIVDQSTMTLRGHSDRIDSIAISPDGKRIVSGSRDRTIKVWDARTGLELMTLQEHKEAVSCVLFNLNGQSFVSGSWDSTIKVWDVATGAVQITIATGDEEGVLSIAFSPDGKRIVSGGSPRAIRVWDATSGAALLTIPAAHEEGVECVAFSSDGKRIISGGNDNMLRIWDAATGEELMSLQGHDAEVESVAVSIDGKRIISGSTDGTIKVWDATTGAPLMTLRGHDGAVNSVILSPDGKRIVSGSSDNMVKVWDAESGTELRTLRGHTYFVYSAVFASDGKQIISGSWDNTIKVWDLATDREFLRLSGNREIVSSVAFSPDGGQIGAGIYDGTIKLWDVSSGTEVITLHGHLSNVYSISFSPDGKSIASGSRDKTIRIWDVATGKNMMTLNGHSRSVRSVAFSPDGRRLASMSCDYSVPPGRGSEIKVWDTLTGTDLMTLRESESWLCSVAFNPDGKRLVSGNFDQPPKVWDAATGTEILTLHGHEGRVYPMTFSRDGTHIVSGGQDKTIRIWDANTGAELMTLRGHRGMVFSLALSPDGKRIVSGSQDGTVRVWDAATGAELETLRLSSTNVLSVAFSPDGRNIAAGGWGMNVGLWESGAAAGEYEARMIGAAATKLVDELHEKHGSYREVISQLQRDATLGPAVRKLAIQIAKSRKWEDIEKLENELENEAWKVIVAPDADIKAYQAALERTGEANALEPNDPAILTTLGVGQYRVGSYEDSLKTLARSAEILSDAGEEPDPANAAFKAMTLHQLGRGEEAKAALEELRALLKDEQFANNQAAKALLAEAEGLIEGKPVPSGAEGKPN